MKANERKIGVVLSYLAIFLSIGISLLFTPFMLRKLGQAEYGLLSLVNSIVAYLTILDFGFSNAIVRYTAKHRAQGDKEGEQSLYGMFLLLYLVIGIVSFVVGLFVLYNMGSLFGNSLSPKELEIAKVLFLIAIIDISVAFPLSLYSSIIIAYEKFTFSRLMQLIRICITPLFTLAILIVGYKAIGMMVVTITVSILIDIANFVYCRRKLNIRMSFQHFNLSILKEIIIYSFYIFLNMIIDRLYWTTDKVILGIYSGAAAVSIYSIGAQFCQYFMQLSTAISGVFLPKITELSVVEDKASVLSDLFLKIARIQFVILFFTLSGFILFGKEFIILWAGPEYAIAYEVALLVMIPSIIPLSQNIGIVILQAKNMQKFRSITYLVIAILNVVLSVALVKKYGIIGCTVATGISIIVGQILAMNVYYQKVILLKIMDYWKTIIGIIIKMIPCIILGYIINQIPFSSSYFHILVKIMLFSLLFFLTIWMFVMSKNETADILSYFRRKIRRQ